MKRTQEVNKRKEGGMSRPRAEIQLGMDHVATVGDMVAIEFYCELIEGKK